MPKRCALGCPPIGVSTHVFPHPKRFPETFKAWVEIVGGKLETPEDYKLYGKMKICDIHFTEKDKNRNNRLNCLAIPTMFLPDALCYCELFIWMGFATMPHSCALGCNNSGVMHSFPKPDKYPERFKTWVAIVGKKIGMLSDNEVYKLKRICDIHFLSEHKTRYNRLSNVAVPLLHLPDAEKKLLQTFAPSRFSCVFFVCLA
ncbi:hypothetical protein evm_012704 [Chilo suppressalis]|nr:hypothetical protein evm_012704 [Chilo suppressalis]